jgi:hypothetical protein
MVAIQHLLEMEWREASEQYDAVAQRWIAETACFFLIGYCGSICGFRPPKALLTNLRHSLHLEDGPHGHPPHVAIFFLGRFKARSNAENKILVFLAAVLDLGLQPALWLGHLVKILDGCGIFSGWLFQGYSSNQCRHIAARYRSDKSLEH